MNLFTKKISNRSTKMFLNLKIALGYMYICKKVHFTVPSTTFKSYIINTPSVVNAHVFQKYNF